MAYKTGNERRREASKRRVNNNANTNLFVHIAAIEGLAQQINDHLNALTEDNLEQHTVKLKAMQNRAEWQKTDLHELRKAYE